MATQRARTAATWIGLGLLAAVVAATVWQPWLGFGVVIGFFGGAATFMIVLQSMLWLDDHGHLPSAPLAVGAVAASLVIIAAPTGLAMVLLGPRGALTAAIACAVPVVGFFGRIELGRQVTRHRLRQLDRALEFDGDVPAALAQVPPEYRFVVTTKLADHGRWSLVLDYLARNPGRATHARYTVDWQVAAHLALGDAAAAQAALDAAPAPEGEREELLAALQAARVRIARGDAAAVAAELADDVELSPELASLRASVRADALAASGDDDGARAALIALRERHGDGFLAQLGRRQRPCSALARALADGAAAS